jgi:hypothetical protein
LLGRARAFFHESLPGWREGARQGAGPLRRLVSARGAPVEDLMLCNGHNSWIGPIRPLERQLDEPSLGMLGLHILLPILRSPGPTSASCSHVMLRRASVASSLVRTWSWSPWQALPSGTERSWRGVGRTALLSSTRTEGLVSEAITHAVL